MKIGNNVVGGGSGGGRKVELFELTYTLFKYYIRLPQKGFRKELPYRVRLNFHSIS